jgi:hypothetical protein
MNQLETIQETTEQKVISKAKVIATSRRVRCESNPMIWCVQSETSEKFYCVRYDDELGSFMCDCKVFKFSPKECKNVYAAALKEGGYV